MQHIVVSEVKCFHNASRYNKFIQSRIELNKIRDLSNIRTENHHIIPRSMGGSNDKTNYARLTLREHFLAHLMLMCTYKNSKMTLAYIMMGGRSKNNSHLYEKYRNEFVNNIVGKNNPMYGKTHTKESISKIKQTITFYKFTVDGITYEDSTVACAYLNISYDSLRYRCLNDEYPTYSMKLIDENKNPISGDSHHSSGLIMRQSEKDIRAISNTAYNYIINDIVYLTSKDAVQAMGESLYKINKKCNDDNFPHYKKELVREHLKSCAKEDSHWYGKEHKQSSKDKIMKSNAKYTYNIDGIHFEYTRDAMEHYGLTKHQLFAKCKNNKFPNFIRTQRLKKDLN